MNNATQFSGRLRKGDLVRVISFGLSLKGVSPSQREVCNTNLVALGLRVSFGKYVEVSDEFDTSSVADRVEDLNEALMDPEVKLILSGLGGMNTAQILQSINWNLLRDNPKIFCGFSDITVLVNAIYAKTGIVTYYGPFYGTFGMKKGVEYTLETFRTCVFSTEPFIINPTRSWSDDFWWLDQENRKFLPNPGPLIIAEGDAEGRLIGGHLTSLTTLFGTEFLPDLSNSILMLEENGEIRPRSFDRLLQSLIHQKGFKGVKALLIGRFTSASQISDGILVKIIRNYPKFSQIPVVANLNFGHTYPQFTFPIGGTGRINAKVGKVVFEIIKH
ncbi:MAG: LD-carboxypeptidase [Candidatus Taylorbacteria bacterium]|nr:LD-carboxypeptidase [Candidatus Taylorbacteria bacterium]